MFGCYLIPENGSAEKASRSRVSEREMAPVVPDKQIFLGTCTEYSILRIYLTKAVLPASWIRGPGTVIHVSSGVARLLRTRRSFVQPLGVKQVQAGGIYRSTG